MNSPKEETSAIIEQIAALKKENGRLSEEDVLEILGKYDLSEEETEKVFSSLAKNGLEPSDPSDVIQNSADASSDSLSLYYSQMGQYQRLSDEEIFALAKKVKRIKELQNALEEAKKKKDEQESDSIKKELEEAMNAKNDMILANLRLVVDVAKHYWNYSNSIPLIDLIQEGNLGLEKAVEKFDPDKGYRFSTYAYWWIRQAILHFMNGDSRIIKIPSKLLLYSKKVRDARDELKQSTGKEPKLSEIAEKTGLTIAQIDECLSLPLGAVSMDAPIGEDGDAFSSIIADPDTENEKKNISKEEDEQIALSAMSILSPKEKEIISRNYGLNGREPESLQEIGDSFGITRERVRQIRERALIKMRKRIEG